MGHWCDHGPINARLALSADRRSQASESRTSRPTLDYEHRAPDLAELVPHCSHSPERPVVHVLRETTHPRGTALESFFPHLLHCSPQTSGSGARSFGPPMNGAYIS